MTVKNNSSVNTSISLTASKQFTAGTHKSLRTHLAANLDISKLTRVQYMMVLWQNMQPVKEYVTTLLGKSLHMYTCSARLVYTHSNHHGYESGL